MGVEDPPLHPELNVAQLGIVHELGIDPRRAAPRPAARGRVGRVAVLGEDDLVDGLLAVAGAQHVSQEQGRALRLVGSRHHQSMPTAT